MSRPLRHDPLAASSAPGPLVPATAGSPRGVDARQRADTVAGHIGAGAHELRMSCPLSHDPFATSSAPGPLVPATAGSLRGVDARQQADTVAGHIGAGAHEARMSRPLRHDPFASSSTPGPLVPATAGSPRGVDSRQRADTVAGHIGAGAHEACMSRPFRHDPFAVPLPDRGDFLQIRGGPQMSERLESASHRPHWIDHSGRRISSPPRSADSWARMPQSVMLADCTSFG